MVYPAYLTQGSGGRLNEIGAQVYIQNMHCGIAWERIPAERDQRAQVGSVVWDAGRLCGIWFVSGCDRISEQGMGEAKLVLIRAG